MDYRIAVCLCAIVCFPPGAPAEAQIDLAAPFSVGSALDFPPPDYLFTNGMRTHGVLSGPVNAPRSDLSFFTHPAFAKKGETGRLFYQVIRLANRHDPYLEEQSAWFICWQPATTGKASGAMAQRLFSRSGYDILEIETDGKRLLLRLTPVFRSKRMDIPTDTYRWTGDSLGHGKFVPEGMTPPLKHLLPKPNSFQMHRDQGYAFLSQSDWKQAGAAFQKALALRPKDAACWFARGVASEGDGVTPGSPSLKQAIAAYSKAITLDPARTPAYRSRAGLLAFEGQFDRAIADLTQVIRQEPTIYTNYTMRAQVQARKGDFAKAAADARKAAQIEPTESEPLTLLAEYYYRSGNYPLATASAQKALAHDESENQARLILTYIYARQNQIEKAKKQLLDARANGITTTERQDGITEVRRILKTQPNSVALKTVHDLLRGPENLEP